MVKYCFPKQAKMHKIYLFAHWRWIYHTIMEVNFVKKWIFLFFPRSKELDITWTDSIRTYITGLCQWNRPNQMSQTHTVWSGSTLSSTHPAIYSPSIASQTDMQTTCLLRRQSAEKIKPCFLVKVWKLYQSSRSVFHQKVLIFFFLFLQGNIIIIIMLYSLKAPHRGTSNEYPHHMFS